MGIELKFEKILVSPAACGGIGTKSPATLRNQGCESRKVRVPLLGSSSAIEKRNPYLSTPKTAASGWANSLSSVLYPLSSKTPTKMGEEPSPRVFTSGSSHLRLASGPAKTEFRKCVGLHEIDDLDRADSTIIEHDGPRAIDVGRFAPDHEINIAYDEFAEVKSLAKVGQKNPAPRDAAGPIVEKLMPVRGRRRRLSGCCG